MAKKINPLSIDPLTGLTINNEHQTPDLSGISSTSLTPEFGGLAGIGESRHDDIVNIQLANEDANYLESARASDQSGLELLGKALGQGTVETTLGALEGIGYVLDFEEFFNNEKQAQEGFDNWFSSAVRGVKEDLQEHMHIYKSETARNGTLGQKITDGTWWASHGKTIGTTASLMIPSIGVAKAVGLLGRAGKVISPFTAAAFSRKAESVMEGNQKFQEAMQYWENHPDIINEVSKAHEAEINSLKTEYDKLSTTLNNPQAENYGQLEAQRAIRMKELEASMTILKDQMALEADNLARQKSGEESAKTVKANLALLPFDILQYGLIMSPLKNLTKTLSATERKVGNVSRLAGQAISEGEEERFQFVGGAEASSSVREGTEFFGKGFRDRLDEYNQDEDLKEAVFLGRAMGLLFDVGGKALNKAVDKTSEAEKVLNNPNASEAQKQKYIEKFTVDFIMEKKSKGKTDDIFAMTKLMREKINSNEELSSEEKKENLESIDELENNVKYVLEQDEVLKKDERFKDEKVRDEYLSAKIGSMLADASTERYTGMLNDNLESKTSGLSTFEGALHQKGIEVSSITKAKKEFVKSNNLTRAEKKDLDKYVSDKINALRAESNAILGSIKEANPDFQQSKSSPRNSEQIKENTLNKLISEMEKFTHGNRLNKFDKSSTETSSKRGEELSKEELKKTEEELKERLRINSDVASLESLNREIEQNYNGLFPDLQRNAKNKLKGKKAKAEKAAEKARQTDTYNKMQGAISGATTQAELTEILNNLESLNLSKSDTQNLTRAAKNKADSMKAPRHKLEKTANPKVKVLKDGKRSMGGKVGEVIGTTKSGMYKVKFPDGKTSTYKPETLTQVTSDIFDNEGKPIQLEEDKDVNMFTVGPMPTTEIFESEQTEEVDGEVIGSLNDDGTVSTAQQEEGEIIGSLNDDGTVNQQQKDEGEVIGSLNDDGTISNVENNKAKKKESEAEFAAKYGLNTGNNTSKKAANTDGNKNPENTEQPMLDSRMIEQLDKNQNEIDGQEKAKQAETSGYVQPVTSAKKRAKNGRDEYSKGKIILTENYDPTMASPSKFKVGDSVVLTINEEFLAELKKKGVKITAENLPIHVMDKTDYEAGKKGYVSIRDLSSDKWKNMDADTRAKTMALRQRIFDAYNDKTGKKTQSPQKDISAKKADIERRRNEELSGKRSKESLDRINKRIDTQLSYIDKMKSWGAKTLGEAIDYITDNFDENNPVSKLRKQGLSDEEIDNHPEFKDFVKFFRDGMPSYINDIVDGYDNKFDTNIDEVEAYLKQERLEAPNKNVRIGKSKKDKINAKYDAELEALSKVKETDGNVFYTTILDKDYGWTNRSERPFSLAFNLKKPDGTYPTGVVLAASNRKGRAIKLENGEQAINKNVPAGIPHAVIPTATGEKVGIRLNYSEIGNDSNYSETVDTVYQLIMDYISGKLDNNTVNINDEVSKYVFLRNEVDDKYKSYENEKGKIDANGNYSESVRSDIMNNIFGLIQSNNDFKLFLPAKKGYKLIRISNKDGDINAITYENGNESPYNLEELKVDMLRRLVNMYPNISSYHGQTPHAFNRYVINESGELEKIKEHYFDYLSENTNVKTKVHPVYDADGNPHYVTQPNMRIDHEIRNEEEQSEFESQPKKVSDTQLKEEVQTEQTKKEAPKKSARELAREKSKKSGKKKPSRTKKTEDRGNMDSTEIDNFEVDDFDATSGVDLNNATLSSFKMMDSIETEDKIVASLLVDVLNELDKQKSDRRKSLDEIVNRLIETRTRDGKSTEMSIVLEEANLIYKNQRPEGTTDFELALDEVLIKLQEDFEMFDYHSEEDISQDEANEDGVFTSHIANANAAKNLETIINNFEELINEDGIIEFIGYREKLKLEVEALSFNPLNEMEEAREEENDVSGDRFVEGANYKTDPEKSLSSQIRRMLSGIERLTPAGKTISTGIGTKTYHESGSVFNYLIENLSNIPIGSIMEELNDLAIGGNQIAIGVTKRLSELGKNNGSDVNKFLNVMRKQRAKFITISHKETVKGNDIRTVSRLIEANKSGTKDVLTDEWMAEFSVKSNQNGLLIDENGQTTVSKKVGSRYANTYQIVIDDLGKGKVSQESKKFMRELGLNPTASVYDNLRIMLDGLGIDFSNAAMDKLRKDFKHRDKNRSFKAEFGSAANVNKNTSENAGFKMFFNDAFSNIFESLRHGKNPFETELGRIKSLAKYQQKFETEIYSQSFRNSNGDMLYGHVNSHHLNETIDKLKRKDDVQTQNLKKNAFSKNSTWLQDTDGIDLFYFDAAKNSKSGSQSREYQEQTPVEKEVTKVNLYLNGNNKTHSYFFTISPSDKTTFALIKAMRLNTTNDIFSNGELKLSDSTADTLYDLLFASELERINETISSLKSAKRKLSFEGLIEGNHYYSSDKKLMSDIESFKVANSDVFENENVTVNDAYTVFEKRGAKELSKELDSLVSRVNKSVTYGAGGYFFMVPALNDSLEAFRDESGSIAINEDGVTEVYGEIVEAVDATIKDFVQSEIAQKIDFWSDLVVQSFDTNSFQSRKTTENIATEYVINNMVSYANQLMLITGDPAQFGKMPKEAKEAKNWISIVRGTLSNLFKRTAKDIAPGYEGNFKKENYNMMFFNEPTKDSQLGKEIKDYLGITLADAQEFTTLAEHLNVMEAMGVINETENQEILEAANNGTLSYAQVNKVMQPMKPVQVLNSFGGTSTSLNSYYVKTSSYPLIPGYTEGFPELDKLRIFMEENGIDRAVPKTAVKTGFHSATTLFENGKFIEDNSFSNAKIIEMNRSGFRIQQDVPFDPNKSMILEGSQLRKLIHADLEEGFSINGKALKAENDAIHNELYKRRSEKLRNKIKAGKDGVITDVTPFRDMLAREAIERQYGHNEVLMTNTQKVGGKTKFSIPLFFHNMPHKIESLLNSMIKNKVLKNKLPGASKVQGSALGYDVASEEFLKRVTRNEAEQPILTKDYKGELDYRTDENGLYAEVMLPLSALGVNASIEDFVDKDGFLDESKINPEVLEMIGYRIPTQNYSSVIRMKVVGILPKMSGDLVIVPGAMTVQMGSDFDVDKLYMYRYNNKMSKDGKVDRVKSNGKINSLSDEALQNRLIDVYMQVLKSPEVSEKAKKSLDNTEIEKVIKNDLGGVNNEVRSIVSDGLHSEMIEIQAAGQFGIGITSIASTNHALSQYAGVYLAADPEKINEAPRLLFSDKKGDKAFNDHESLEQHTVGDKIGYGPKSNTANSDIRYGLHAKEGAFRLDKIYGFSGKLISDVITNIQTESVDNANNGRLHPMNLNKDTFGVAMLMARSGFDERMIGLFLNQPVIKTYIRNKALYSNYTKSEFIQDAQAKLIQEMLEGMNVSTPSKIPSTVSIQEMKEAIENDTFDNEFQTKVFESYIFYEKVANELQKAQKALNVDSKYLGASFGGVVTKLNDVMAAQNSKIIGNVTGLLDGTTTGGAVEYGVFQTLELFGHKNLLPHNSPIISNIIEEMMEVTKKDISERDFENILIGIRSALWNDVMLSEFPEIGNINNYRRNLLFGKNTLAKRVTEAKRKYPNNPFIQSLNPKISYDTKEPSTIEHNSSKDSKTKYDFRKQHGWLELLKSKKGSEEYQLGLDLFIYSTTFGTERNARDFGRFIPYDFLVETGLSEKLRDIDFVGDARSLSLSENFIKQWYQHNPNKLYEVDTSDTIGRTGANELSLKSESVSDENIKGKDSELPDYVKIFNKKTYSVDVYEFIGDGKLIKLDRLGHGAFITEYNILNPRTKTTFDTNSRGANFTPSTPISSAELEKFKNATGGKAVLEAMDFDSGIEAVLENIAKFPTSDYSELAKFILDNVENLDIYSLERLDFNNPEHHKSNSKYGVAGRHIPNKYVLINESKMINSEYFSRVFMHEIMHAYSSNLFNADKAKLDANQLAAREKFEKFYEEVKTKVNEHIAKLPQNKDNEALIKRLNYATSSPKELIAEIFTNQDLIDFMNKTKSQGGASLWNKFVNIIKSIFGNVKKGSLLEKGVHLSLKAIEENVSLRSIEMNFKNAISVDDFTEGAEISKKCKGN